MTQQRYYDQEEMRPPRNQQQQNQQRNGQQGGKNQQQNYNDKPKFNPNQQQNQPFPNAKVASANDIVYQEVVMIADGDTDYLLLPAMKYYTPAGPVNQMFAGQIRGFCMMQPNGSYFFYKDTEPEYQMLIDRIERARNLIWDRVEQREKKQYRNRRSAKGMQHGIAETGSRALSWFWILMMLGIAAMVLFLIFALPK